MRGMKEVDQVFFFFVAVLIPLRRNSKVGRLISLYREMLRRKVASPSSAPFRK